MKKQLFIKVANFKIKVVFYKPAEERKIFFLNFYDQFLKYFSGFIISKNSSQKFDGLIEIKDNQFFQTITKKNKFFFFGFEKIKNNHYLTYYQINIDHFFLLIQELIFYLLKEEGFFLHCSSIVKNNQAYLFLAPSGGGKSTIVKLIQDKDKILVDDLGIIRKIKNNFYLFQTPVREKNQYPKSFLGYKIRKIFFIKKAKFLKKEKISLEKDYQKYLELFIKQVWVKKRLTKKTFFLINDLFQKKQIGFYQLRFKKRI